MRILAYPANLAFAGIAGFLLALPLVTAVPASVAVARSLDGWLSEDSTTVFTSTFREFAATWRRTLALGFLAIPVVGFTVFNLWFLWSQLQAGDGGTDLVIAAASIPVAIVVSAALLTLPVAATRNRDGSTREWLAGAGYLLVTRPLRVIILVVLSVASVATMALLPSLLPFFGMSLPLFLALSSFASRDPEPRDEGR